MKRIVCMWSLIFGLQHIVAAQGITFFQGSWEAALEKALEEEKPIFVDAFTTWCGPCKMMSQQVFPVKQVGTLFNDNFVSIKIDMEKEEGIRFKSKYPVTAYPTLLFIDGNGKLLKKVIGAQQVDGLIQLGRGVLESFSQTGALAEAYERGERDPELVYKYIRSLNRAGKPSLRIANDYLRSQPDLNTEANLKVIFEAATEADSWVFDRLIQYRQAIEKQMSVEKVDKCIYEACRKTADKGLQLPSQQLIEEAKEKMKLYLPNRAKAFASLLDMEEATAGKDDKVYVKALYLYAKNAETEPVESLKQVVYKIEKERSSQTQPMEVASTLLEMVAKKMNKSKAYLDLGVFLLKKGDKAGAQNAAVKAKELAADEGAEAQKEVADFMLKLS